MTKNLILFTAVLCLFFTSAFAQSTITGIVKDATGKGLPYANIGIRNGKIGTISTVEGKFSITLADSLLNDSLSFSSIGFNDQSLKIASLVGQNSIEVLLTEKITTLSEVKISNVKRKQYKLGITGRTPMMAIPSKSYQKTDIIEQARLIHLKKPAQLLNANIYVLSESMKEVQIRINFYAVENGLPGKRLVEKTIIRKGNIEKGWFAIDLKDEGIYLDQDFVVGFEYLPSSQNAIVFGAKIGAADSFLRNSSLGIWRKNVVGGCSIYVTAEM